MSTRSSVQASKQVGNQSGRSTKPLTKKRQPRRQDRFVTHKELTGYRFELSGNVPPIEQIPWNKLTLVSMHKGVTDVTEIKASEIANALKNQIDPDSHTLHGSPQVDLKITTVRVWNLTGKSLAVTVFDYTSPVDVQTTTATEEALIELMDNKSDEIPAIGYSLPASVRSHVITNASMRPRKVLSVLGSSGSDIMVVLNIHWKPNGIPKPLYTGFSDLSQIRQKVTKIASTIDSDDLPLFRVRGDVEVTNAILDPVPIVPVPVPISAHSANDSLRHRIETLEEKLNKVVAIVQKDAASLSGSEPEFLQE